MGLHKLIVAFCCALVAAGAVADMPSTQRIRNERIVAYGDTTITQIFDSTLDPMGPDFILKVTYKGELKLLMNQVQFQNIYASPDHSLFLGLSNSGWPGSAVIIFNREGTVLFQADHGTTAFEYCAQTSTMLKQWYDDEKPEVRFPDWRQKYSGEVPGITLKNCSGNTVDLLETIRKGNAAGYQSLRNSVLYSF